MATVETATDYTAYLSVTVTGRSEDREGASFRLDTLAFHSLDSLKALPGASLVLDDECADPFNELGNSFVCEAGEQLEIDSMSLKFGSRQGDTLSVGFEATCHRKTDPHRAIAVSVNCDARMQP